MFSFVFPLSVSYRYIIVSDFYFVKSFSIFFQLFS
nr:MAG TPA: hypothetical protein [Caudoviricetes sp.]